MESARMLAEAISSKLCLTAVGRSRAVVEIIDAYNVDTIASFIAERDAAIRKERADEIERLRKWQQEAVCWLEGARTTMELVGAPKDMKDNLNRLIAEAQED